MRRQKVEHLVTNGMIEGKWQDKMFDGLVTDALKATRDLDAGKDKENTKREPNSLKSLPGKKMLQGILEGSDHITAYPIIISKSIA